MTLGLLSSGSKLRKVFYIAYFQGKFEVRFTRDTVDETGHRPSFECHLLLLKIQSIRLKVETQF